MTNRNTIYYPALSAGPVLYLSKYTDEELISKHDNYTKSCRFYNVDVDNYFDYPYVLFSAAHHYKFKDFKKVMDLNLDKSLVMIDSGGFQLATGAMTEKEWNDEKALKWSEENGNVFPILDRPPRVTGTAGTVDPAKFAECLVKSVESAKYYAEHRSVSGTRILNVLQGQTIHHMEAWYKEMCQVELEGWAHGGTSGVRNVLQGIMFLASKGEFNKPNLMFHHAFGVSRSEHFLYLAYLQRLMNDKGYNIQITFDSSSPNLATRFARFYTSCNYDGFRGTSMSRDHDWSKLREGSTMPPLSPVFKEIKNILEFKDKPEVFNPLAMTHNVYMFMKFKEFNDALVNCGVDDMLFEALNARQTRNLKCLRKIVDNPEKAQHFLQTEWDDGKDVDMVLESNSLIDMIV